MGSLTIKFRSDYLAIANLHFSVMTLQLFHQSSPRNESKLDEKRLLFKRWGGKTDSFLPIMWQSQHETFGAMLTFAAISETKPMKDCLHPNFAADSIHKNTVQKQTCKFPYFECIPGD
jgi:hypothetical protein